KNTFVGEDAGNFTLNPDQGGASFNVAIGNESLKSITSASNNVALGAGTLGNSLTSSNCTVAGSGAASSATNLVNSEVIGINALAYYNYTSPFTEHNMVVIGTGACQFITTAARDIWIGTRAGLLVQTSGFYNTCI